MTPPITLEPVTAGQYQELAEFNARFEDETRPVEFWLGRFRLWWDDNPAWDAGAARGWILVAGGGIVGFVGVIPARFRMNAADTRAVFSTTWRVHAAHRGASLKLMTAVVAAGSNQVLFSTTAKREIAPIMQALGYRRMPALGGDRSLLVVDAARFAAATGGRAVASAARLLAPLVRRTHYHAFSLLSRSGLEVRRVRTADSAFDALWEHTRDQYPTATVRNAAWVNWQCFTSPFFAKEVVAAYDGARLRGFAIAIVADWKGLRILDCVDLWCDFDDAPVAAALARGLGDAAIERGCAVVQVPHFNKAIGRALDGKALLKTTREPISGFWRGPKPFLEGSSTQNAYLTLIEGDRYL
jgi:hypothetical protein